MADELLRMQPETLDEALFPSVEPFDSGYLEVGEGHRIYYEQSGNPEGIPLVHLHGGPGAGFRPINRRYFDPAVWRIVLFDQRGCGRSEPYAELQANTTQHLVSDIEKLRLHLGVGPWAVSGGSWGSFLALAYAQAYPDAVLGLLLRGIALGRKFEFDWWWQDGISALFPEHWRALRDFLPEEERGDVLAGYYKRLIHPDPEIHLPSAVAIRTFLGWVGSFRPNAAYVQSISDPKQALTSARIFSHYCVKGFFMLENAVLHGVERIRHLPCVIVQGRYDVVTPPRTAWDLKEVWPEAEFTIVTESNHSIDEPDMAAELVRAQARLRTKLR
ncbi:prolyl aminopeptidase [Microvirga sp. 2YAF29]